MLEAKDTKKAEAKASLFEDRHFRTDNLEAKGQGRRTHAQVFKKKKKKGLQKSFSSDLQFIGVPRIFGWGRPKPQITCNEVIKIFPKRNFLWDKEMEWKI